jgi:choline dehydrogenase
MLFAGVAVQKQQQASNSLTKKELRKIIKSKYDGEDDPCIVDYLVVGVGSASAIMILNLTEDRTKSVVALEWGQDYRDDPVILYGAGNNIRNAKYSENYIATTNIQAPAQLYGFGRMVGGSSAHPTAAKRGSPEFYDTLAEVAGPRWSYANVLPLLKALETYLDYPTNVPIGGPTRGESGPMVISRYPASYYNASPADQALNEQLAEIMWSVTPESPTPILDLGGADYNAGQNTYVTSVNGQNWIEFDPNAPSGDVLHSVTGYAIIGQITDANGKGLDGRKLQIVTEAFVDKILFHGNVAIGAEFLRHGKIHRVFAKDKVVIAASTLRSPIILEQSGIGDPAILEPAGIPLLMANTNVGNHMLDEVYYQIAFNVNDPTLSYQAGGRLTLGSTALPYPPFLIVPGAPWFPTSIATAYGFNANTKKLQLQTATFSENSSHIATNNKAGQINVIANFFSNPEDIVLGRMGAQYIKSFVDAAAVEFPELGMYMVYPPESAFVGPASNLDTYLKNAYNHGDHEVGTCRISATEVDGVVDGDLHVHGFQHLMVADLSVIPMVVDANTFDLALVIGQLAAQIITGNTTPAVLPPPPFPPPS